jgi:LmbE family N-acetylglucosaminyl deacetylase
MWTVVHADVVQPTSVVSEEYVLNSADDTINNDGMNTAVNGGDTLISALEAIHQYGSSYKDSYASTDPGGYPSDFFASLPGGDTDVDIVFDLTGGGDTDIGSVILWQYENSGGGTSRAANHARTIEIYVNTEAQGDTIFNESPIIVTLFPVTDGDAEPDNDLGGVNSAQFFSLGSLVNGRYVQLSITDNYYGLQGMTSGGDRVGLGEVRFATELTFELITTEPTNPIPENGDNNVPVVTDSNPATDPNTTLSWTAPTEYIPVGYDVCFGTEPNELHPDYDMIKIKQYTSFTGTALDPLIYYTESSGETWYDPAKTKLNYETTYQWYVVAYDGVTPHAGPVWSFTTKAEPPIPQPPCAGYRYDGDVDGDCYVGLNDLLILTGDWLNEGIGLAGDIDEDEQVNLFDYAYVGRDWLTYINQGSIMVVSAHPDDEGIFFGGALPYYAQVLEVKTIHVSMTSGDWGRPPEVREAELTNADTVYFGRTVTASIGLPPDPSADLFFPRFKDAPTGTVDETWDYWNDGIPDNGDAAEGKQKAIDTVATYIRTFQPDVIITHDFDGEYGHSNHKATAIAVADAYDRAADPCYVDGNDLWQAKKIYIHQSESNGLGTSGRTFEGGWLFHDYWEQVTIDSDNDDTPDMTPRQVADLGLDEHVSQGQPDVSTVYRTGENFNGHHSEWWGLYRTEVGPDTIADPFTIMGKAYNDGNNDGWTRGNFFENLGVIQ